MKGEKTKVSLVLSPYLDPNKGRMLKTIFSRKNCLH